MLGYGSYRGFLLPVGAESPPPPAVPVEIRELGRDELSAFAADPAYEISPRFLAESREREDVCMSAFAGGKLVAYSFNSRSATNIDAGMRFHFPRGWAYHYKAFTLPDWRGKRLHSGMVAAVLRKFAGSPDFKGITTLVVATNYPSLASFERIGFVPTFRFMVFGKGPGRRIIGPFGKHIEGFRIEKLEGHP